MASLTTQAKVQAYKTIDAFSPSASGWSAPCNAERLVWVPFVADSSISSRAIVCYGTRGTGTQTVKKLLLYFVTAAAIAVAVWVTVGSPLASHPYTRIARDDTP